MNNHALEEILPFIGDLSALSAEKAEHIVRTEAYVWGVPLKEIDAAFPSQKKRKVAVHIPINVFSKNWKN